MTVLTPTAEASATTSATRQSRRTPRFVHYFLHSIGHLLRDWAFLAFLIAMPVFMYMLFSGIYGDQVATDGVTVAAVMMVMMATYGGLGAAISAGATIQSERSSGWFRQLMLTPLRPAEFVSAKVLTALAAVVPAIVAVGLAGVTRGVRLPLATWLGSLGLLVVALLPMVVLGLVIGLWFKQNTAGAVRTLIMLALAVVGGLWFPLDMMPPFMQTVGALVPSYWAGQIGLWPLVGGTFPWHGVAVIAFWVVALTALGALGYVRAIRSSRR